jgi:hypothetical protein
VMVVMVNERFEKQREKMGCFLGDLIIHSLRNFFFKLFSPSLSLSLSSI